MRCSALRWTNEKVLYADRHSAALPSWNEEMVDCFFGGILASCAAVLLSHPIEQLGQDFSWKFFERTDVVLRCLRKTSSQVRQSADADSTACWCVLVDDGRSVFVVLSVCSDSVKQHVACMVMYAKQSYMGVSICLRNKSPSNSPEEPTLLGRFSKLLWRQGSNLWLFVVGLSGRMIFLAVDRLKGELVIFVAPWTFDFRD